jgi:hypothetical protein
MQSTIIKRRASTYLAASTIDRAYNIMRKLSQNGIGLPLLNMLIILDSGDNRCDDTEAKNSCEDLHLVARLWSLHTEVHHEFVMKAGTT